MTNLRNLIGLIFLSMLFFTACKKESLTTDNTTKSPEPTTSEIKIDPATQTRAMAAAASVAHSRNSPEDDTTFNDCGCYDLFDNIDFEASNEEIDAAIDAVLEALTEAELTQLFEPVCTDDGEIYESACVADCEGITGYHVCSDDELDDYFFGDFECEDLDSLTFPTEIELPDGTLVTVNSEEELWDVLDKWFEENGDDWEDDYEGEDWEDDYEGEDWEDDFEDCFTVIYPVQVQFPGGEIVTYNSDDELYEGLDAWYEKNLENENEPMPVYPFEVLLPDSTTATVSNEMEEEVLWEECYGDLDFELCFDLAFPLTLIYPDSTTLAVNSEDELEKAIDDFYEANMETEEDIDVQYPINITLTDGTTQAINNEEELDAAFEACFDDFGRIGQASKKSALSAKRVVKGALLSGS